MAGEPKARVIAIKRSMNPGFAGIDYPSAPLILGLVLGDSMERALRQSLMMSQGELGILVSRPISAIMLGLAMLILLLPLFRKANAWRPIIRPSLTGRPS